MSLPSEPDATMSNADPNPQPSELNDTPAPMADEAAGDDPQKRLGDLEARHAEMADAYLRAKADAECHQADADTVTSTGRRTRSAIR